MRQLLVRHEWLLVLLLALWLLRLVVGKAILPHSGQAVLVLTLPHGRPGVLEEVVDASGGMLTVLQATGLSYPGHSTAVLWGHTADLLVIE